MPESLDAARATEIMESPKPQVGSCRLSGHFLEHLVGDDVVATYDLRGAKVDHVVKRDLPEMFVGLVVTAIAVPFLYLTTGDGCSFGALLVGGIFSWIMWIKGNYLVITKPDGDSHEIFVDQDLAEELDLLVLRILSMGL